MKKEGKMVTITGLVFEEIMPALMGHFEIKANLKKCLKSRHAMIAAITFS
jgi:hypothetical protein